MTEKRIFTKQISCCEECPLRTMKRAGMFEDWQHRCKELNRVITKSIYEHTCDPRCPLEKVKK